MLYNWEAYSESILSNTGSHLDKECKKLNYFCYHQYINISKQVTHARVGWKSTSQQIHHSQTHDELDAYTGRLVTQIFD